VEAGQHYEHNCSIAFFTPGSYKLDVVCSLLPAESSTGATGGATGGGGGAGSVSMAGGSVSGPASVPKGTAAALYETGGGAARHVWKFVPAVEVTVKEV